MLTFCSEQCIYALFTDPQISFFINFFIKNGSHITIHTFKNYFATVFSVFSFQFQQNKFYPNTPIVPVESTHLRCVLPRFVFFFFFIPAALFDQVNCEQCTGTFSLKIGSMILFTYLKIISL